MKITRLPPGPEPAVPFIDQVFRGGYQRCCVCGTPSPGGGAYSSRCGCAAGKPATGDVYAPKFADKRGRR